MNICNNYEDPRMLRTQEENSKTFFELVTAASVASAADRAKELLLGSK